MSTEVQHLQNGQTEIVIIKSLGQGAEQIQVRTIVEDAKEFEQTRKKLYADFIKPREDEYQQEVRDYQLQMQKAAREAEEAGN